MIFEWKLDGVSRNFGDALYETFIPPMKLKEMLDDPEYMYFPIGSVICNEVIAGCLNEGYRPYFLGCGWRGEPLNPDLVSECEFIGARGPHTQAELARHGIEVEITGDPAYQIPSLFPAGAPNALAMVIRHIKDTADYNPQSIYDLKADALFSPVVETYDDIVEMIQKISGARFVLAGSMHAAIIAHAYGVPFAPFSGEYIDCPPKWADWFASIGLGEPAFVTNVTEGRQWYKETFKK